MLDQGGPDTGDRTAIAATGEQIVARYASRWSIEQSIKDSKNLLGVGDAHNRLPAAVERTTPLVLANLTILILWYALVSGELLRTVRVPFYRSSPTDIRKKLWVFDAHRNRVLSRSPVHRSYEDQCQFAGVMVPSTFWGVTP